MVISCSFRFMSNKTNCACCDLSGICMPVISNQHHSQVSMAPDVPAFLNTKTLTNNPTADQQQPTNQLD